MGRGGKLLLRKSKKRRVCSEDKGSDDSDEDYVLGEDEENETSDDSDGALSLGEASEETFDFGDDDDEEEERKVVRSKPKKGFSGRRKISVKRSCNRTIVSDEEEDYELDDEEFIPDGIDCVDKSERRAFRSNSQEGSSDRIKRTRERTMVSADYDDGDDDDDDDDDEVNSDDDDEEFMPDGIDCADDEEELLVSKKHKVRNRLMPKRVTAKGRKRKWQSKVSKKPLRKKRRRLRSALMRPKSSDDGFIVVNKVVREKSEKKPGRRKKRSIVFSDSDFIRSGSSDFEYTISEEEREMVRETSIFGGNSTPCLRSSSQLKRLHVNGALQKKAPERKEKEKVEDLQLDLGKQVCGICFSDEGKGVVQGTLDCCSHYFCFACIMEWSKVESRCPLCKQRFATISKPARSNVGIDLRNMVIRIPKRDQVYQPSEEEVRGYLDPYENVVCMECHQGGDDYLMLLCDICDSPAHTYCVSLGREVPEGNWYCEGCRPSDPASSNSTIRPVSDQVTVNSNLPTELSTGDINAEGSDSTFQHSVSVSSPSFSPGIGVLPSPRFVQVENFNATSPLSGVGASTLSGRRRIRYRIHSLLSSYRMNQGAEMASRTDGTSQVNLGSYFVNTELKLGGETTHQNPITSESGRPCFAVEGMAQKSPLCPMQDEDTFAARLSHLRRHVNEGPSTATVSGSAHGILYGDSAEVSEVSGLEQLHQGGSMPTSGIDSSISHNTYTDDPIFMWKKVQRNNCNQW